MVGVKEIKWLEKMQVTLTEEVSLQGRSPYKLYACNVIIIPCRYIGAEHFCPSVSSSAIMLAIAIAQYSHYL